jgi:hypothetical protein
MSDDRQLTVEDGEIERDRRSRIFIAIAVILLTIAIPAALGGHITGDLFTYAPVGQFLGAVLGAFLLRYLTPRLRVSVRLNHAFITIDALKSFFKIKDVYTVYGPGEHASYFWEVREAKNNVSLDEASQNLVAPVITRSGPATLEGSYRIRPRFKKLALVTFLGSVAVIAKEIEDLILAFITQKLAVETIETANEKLKDLNEELKKEFADKESELEKRFGLVVGDVTLSRVRLRSDNEETRAGIDEAHVVAKGTAILLGFQDSTDVDGKVTKAEDKVEEAIKNRTLTRTDVDKARDRFLALTKNIKMDLDSKEISLRIDGDPELTKALGDLGPAIVPVVQAYFNRNRGGSGRRNRDEGASS